MPQADNRVGVIISDNCSSDETSYIVEQYEELYPKIRYVRNNNNIGTDSNILKCMSLATGHLTMLISYNDIIVEGAVGKILSFLEQHASTSLTYLYPIGFTDKCIDIQHCHEYHDHL